MSEISLYRCEKCGNVVALLTNGGGTLVCCGKPMVELVPNTTDGAKEKHVPAVTKANGRVEVAVGSTLHPMLPEHHIAWIALQTGERVSIVYLRPGMEPKAVFADVSSGTVFEYCNLHGLWKADF